MGFTPFLDRSQLHESVLVANDLAFQLDRIELVIPLGQLLFRDRRDV
jgi:hypothetical protein